MVLLFSQQRQNRSKTKQNSSECFAPSTFTSEWKYDDKVLFESLLVRLGAGDVTSWERIASMMPNKTTRQIKQYYEENYYSPK